MRGVIPTGAVLQAKGGISRAPSRFRRDAIYSPFNLMANILYGVNGEGAGHSTRAREVLSHLVAQGHAVHVASFDRGL